MPKGLAPKPMRRYALAGATALFMKLGAALKAQANSAVAWRMRRSGR